ncbi:MAG: hypothetical protein EBZ83_06605 [Verrucomicrobia bacterium]|nr:hypothetical protein [Verrucomicrobiota bacterium]
MGPTQTARGPDSIKNRNSRKKYFGGVGLLLSQVVYPEKNENLQKSVGRATWGEIVALREEKPK